jgi:hypothetical protein
MTVLSYTAVTQSGRTFEIEFPLHPLTRSSDSVGEVVTALLDALSRETRAGKDLSDGDLLQALAMTLALRAHMTEAQPDHMHTLVRELYDTAHQAVQAADRNAQRHA